jgi:DTW domain-containing protein YfiP
MYTAMTFTKKVHSITRVAILLTNKSAEAAFRELQAARKSAIVAFLAETRASTWYRVDRNLALYRLGGHSRIDFFVVFPSEKR